MHAGLISLTPTSPSSPPIGPRSVAIFSLLAYNNNKNNNNDNKNKNKSDKENENCFYNCYNCNFNDNNCNNKELYYYERIIERRNGRMNDE